MIYFKEELDFFAEKIRTINKDLHYIRQKSIKLKEIIHELETKKSEEQSDDHDKSLQESKDKLKTLQKEMSQLSEKKAQIFDDNKLRRTVIKGIPCSFIKDHGSTEASSPEINDIFDQRKTVHGENMFFQSRTQKDCTINIRAEIWKHICKVDQTKEDQLDKYNKNRTESMPVIHCPQQLYHYYRSIHNARSEFDLKKDLARTDLNNPFFLTAFKTEKNPLFNVLNAYANFDKEIGYVQGMNIIASWLLKHLQESKKNGNTVINGRSDFVYENGYKA